MASSDTPRISKDRRRSIAASVRNLHLELWNNRGSLWSNVPTSPLHAVDPGVALEYLGFRVSSTDLGLEYIDGRLSVVAGEIDFANRSVVISIRPSKVEQFFTAAHELGHALLHPGQAGLHRDRPVGGPVGRRDVKEMEADYFASCFLMPEKRFRASFSERFAVDQLHLNPTVAYALCDSALAVLKAKIRSERDLNRLLVECQHYDGKTFQSLKSEYMVSTEAAAIRLEELRLASI